jgi:hypothetical protein
MAATKKTTAKKSESVDAGKNETVEEPVEVTLDMNEEQVLALNEKGVKLNFSVEEFLELSPDGERALYRDNLVNYVSAQTLHKRHVRFEEQPEQLKRVKATSRSLQVIGGTAAKRLEARHLVKDGMHACWKRPDEVDEAVEAGYQFVPDPTKKGSAAARIKEGEVPVEFTGIKQTRHKGDVEQVLMQIPQERYQEHVDAMSIMSKGNYQVEKDRIREVASRLEKDHKLTERLIFNDRGENEPA